jgi:hypothetical protein
MEAERRDGGFLWAVLGVATVIVAAGDFLTASLFGLSCHVSDDAAPDWLDFCEANRGLLPYVGVGVILVGGVATRLSRLRWPLVLGVVIALALGLAPWVMQGQPAGGL